jgi:hypothetical protein
VFRRAAFDEVVQEKGWTFGRKGAGYVALWSRQPTTWSKDGVFGGEGLVADGRKNVWICQLGREKVDGPVRQVAGAHRRRHGGGHRHHGEVPRPGPGRGQLRLGRARCASAGRTIPLAGYKRFDNPYVATEYGQDRYVIAGGGHRLVIDFKTGEHREEAVK